MMQTAEQRSRVLLKASLDILSNIQNSYHADALGITAIWDEADCDGYCLIEELDILLEELNHNDKDV